MATACGFLAVDGVRLFARWWRPPAPGRPVLVFLHDGLGSTEALRDFPARLADACGLPAFGYDRWGYGRSEVRPALPVQLMEEEADRLPRVLRAAGIEGYITVGHSNGGTIALLHAAANPQGLHATVSLSAHVRRDDSAVRQLDRFARWLGPEDMPEWLIRFQGEPQRARRLLDQWIGVWRTYFDTGWSLETILTRIRGPLLALHGENDTYGETSQLAAIQAAVPHALCAVLPGLAHFPHIDDPEGVVARIAAFLKPYAG